MGNLRSVGGRGEVDLDQRAITTEDDIVDLSELDRSDDRHDEQAPATQNGAGEHDEPSEGQPPAAATQPHRTPGEAPPASDGPGRENDKDFDRWVADRAPGLGSALAASKPSTPPLAPDAQDPAPGDAPTAASGTAGVSCEELTVSPVTRTRSRLRRIGPPSRPLGRLARPAAAVGALTLAAGGTGIAINAATTSTPHARAHIAASNAPQTAGPSNRAGDALSATIAAVTSELHALARAVPPARSASHPPHKPRRHRPSHKVGTSNHSRPATLSEQSTASAQTSPPTQTYNSNPAPVTSSSTSQATAGSQTQATSRNQPAFGLGGSLGPGRGAPGTQ
jgi:hypothetical protein